MTILLTACGGGGGGGEDSTPEPSPTPSPGPTTVPPTTPTPASKIDLDNSWTGDFQFNFNDTASLAINSIFNAQQSEAGFYTNNENENNTNLSAYTSTGNEDIDAIITSEEMFIADVSYSAEIDSYFLIGDPHIEGKLSGNGGPSSEDCSVIKVIAPSYQYECFFPYSDGRVEAKMKRLATALDFSRETLDFNPDGYSILNSYYGGDGSNNSKTIFHNGTDAFLATPDGYRNEGAVWMNNIVFVTLDAPVSQDLPYKYHFWDISGGGEPVLTHALECTGVAADCGEDASGMMVQGEGKVYARGRIFSQSNSGTINIKESAIKNPIKGPDNKIWAVIAGKGNNGNIQSGNTFIEIQEVINDSINVSGAIKATLIDTSVEIQVIRGSGIAPIQYPAINLTDQYIMYTKVLDPKDPTSSIEGASFPLTSPLDLGGGYTLEDIGNDNLRLIVPESSEDQNDLIINYKVNNDSSDRSFTITYETISNFRNSEYYDGGFCNSGSCDKRLMWPTPEPHREGICIIDFINNNEKCESFDDYMVITKDLEHRDYGQRFDGNEDYPNPEHQYNLLGHNPPGIHTVNLLEDELLIYFKNSNQNKVGGTLYKASGDISNFMQDGLATFTVTESTNEDSNFDLIMSLIKIE